MGSYCLAQQILMREIESKLLRRTEEGGSETLMELDTARGLVTLATPCARPVEPFVVHTRSPAANVRWRRVVYERI